MNTKAKVSDLKALHKQYLNPNLDSRVATMRKMAVWFEEYIPFVKARWNSVQEGYFQTALKIRGRAMDARTPVHEADTALRMMIRKFEQACNEAALPVLAETIQNYEKNAARLEAALAAKQARYTGLLETLNQTFAVFGVKFGLDERVKTIAAAPGSRVLVNPDTAETLLGLTATELLFRFAPATLKALSLEVGTGGLTYSFGKYQEASVRLIEHLQGIVTGAVQFNPVVNASTKAKAPKAPKAPKVSQASSTPASGEYRGAKAQVFGKLVANAGYWVDVKDLFAGLSVAEVCHYRYLLKFRTAGQANGKWVIEIDRKGCRARYSAV